MKDASRRWVEAGIGLAGDPFVVVPCPERADGIPSIIDVPFGTDASKIDRHMSCPDWPEWVYVVEDLGEGRCRVGGFIRSVRPYVKEGPEPEVYLREAKELARRESSMDLSALDLHHAPFFGLNLEGALLAGAQMRSAFLQDARLAGANLDRARMPGADLACADLRGASLRGAILLSAGFESARLEGADLTGADLRGARLANAAADARTKWPDGFDPVRHGARMTAQR